jgi:hypothetical protein
MNRGRFATFRLRALALVAFTMPCACVEWRSVGTPPVASVSLPRFVRVTTRDSGQRLLEDAHFRGDTLVGRAADGEEVRIPSDGITRLEARVPSLSRSAGVAALILAGVVAVALAIRTAPE